jgi:OOP family OmpA-OmpF porin
MKRSRQTLWLSMLLITVLLAGCAGQQARTMPPFEATNLTAAGYDRRVDNFVILLDASSSMASRSMGLIKFETAKEFVNRLNLILPELGYQDAFISFGHHKEISRKHTVRHHGLKPYTTAEMLRSLDAVTKAGGTTPMAKAIDANRGLLDGATGKIAVLLIGDGLDLGEPVLEAASRAREKFGDRLCIYPVLVGDDPAGRQLMQSLAQTAGCGFFTQAEETLSGEAMADFATRVFLTAKAAGPKDTDGDGVYDHLDRCPGTPRGTLVDAVGCPLQPKPAAPVDSDGDGVMDDDDYCPDTPRGATVDDRGCWVLQGIEFETNKADIRPEFEPELEAVFTVLKNNPTVKIQVQGHTDSVGDAAYNRQLSEKRARAVMEYLIQEGIDRKRLSAIGLGEARPIANNDSAEGRELNRRVELKPMP